MNKKRLILIFIVLLLFGGYFYWMLPVTLKTVLPDKEWVGAQLWWYDETFESHEITVDEEMLQQILGNIYGETVTRRTKFTGMTTPHFWLLLYSGDGYPDSLTIVQTGDVSFSPELHTDRRQYYDGAEELYQQLLELSGNG